MISPEIVFAWGLMSLRSRRVGGGKRLWDSWVSEIVIARHYNVSARTVRRWRAQGMPSRLLGGSRRFRLSEVESWHAEKSAL